MKEQICQWNVVKDYFLRFTCSIRFFSYFFSMVILLLLCIPNPAFAWSPDWSDVRSEPFSLSDAPGVVNPVLTASDVNDVNAEFVADPFLFRTDNRWYMFFEVLNKDRGLGEIGLATSHDGMVWDYDGIVLRENLHLSYPLVFEHDGTYYMIPDFSGDTGVWLYEAVEFPFEWKYVATLIDGRNYADATVFFYNGKWWMFAGEGWFSGRGNCYLFYSDDLRSGWTEHPKSPIVVGDAGIARPGGRSFVFDTNRVVRIAQKDDVIYGQRVRAFEIGQLNETDYIEHEIPLSPILYESGDGWNASGMHHFSPWWTGSKWIAAVDGQDNDIWSIGMYVADSGCLLNSKFDEAVLESGSKYYTDREYTLTSLPSAYIGMDAILTPNAERNFTAPSDYMKFEMPFDGTVYLAYDSRATSLPNWMSGFIDTGDRIYTSLSTQPYLKVLNKSYAAGDCVNLGANKAPGFVGATVSNYLVFYGTGATPPPPCSLASKFARTTLGNGVKYYTDRDYMLTGVPSAYAGMDTIITPNDDRNMTTVTGYLTFKMPYDGTMYVAYDSRATSEPDWMNGFIDTGDVLLTSLSTQPSLKIFSRMVDQGGCINLGANKAPGFSGGTVSNYVVFYNDGNVGPGDCDLDNKFDMSTMAVGAYYYTDRDYMITGGVPDWMLGRMLIQTPNDERKHTVASGYIRFTNPVSWWVYVLFDSRSASIPDWLNGWELRSDYKVATSLSSQPYLKVYRKMFDAGQCVDLGGNYGPGSSSETRSNYVVVYGK